MICDKIAFFICIIKCMWVHSTISIRNKILAIKSWHYDTRVTSMCNTKHNRFNKSKTKYEYIPNFAIECISPTDSTAEYHTVENAFWTSLYAELNKSKSTRNAKFSFYLYDFIRLNIYFSKTVSKLRLCHHDDISNRKFYHSQYNIGRPFCSVLTSMMVSS